MNNVAMIYLKRILYFVYFSFVVNTYISIIFIIIYILDKTRLSCNDEKILNLEIANCLYTYSIVTITLSYLYIWSLFNKMKSIMILIIFCSKYWDPSRLLPIDDTFIHLKGIESITSVLLRNIDWFSNHAFRRFTFHK